MYVQRAQTMTASGVHVLWLLDELPRRALLSPGMEHLGSLHLPSLAWQSGYLSAQPALHALSPTHSGHLHWWHFFFVSLS